MKCLTVLTVLLAAFPMGGFLSATTPVALLRTPDHGIQPQAVIDKQGTVHLIYFKGDPKAGNIFYVRQAAGTETFTPPVLVNSQRGMAMAVGTIRGAQLAVGKNGRAHVAWNGPVPAGQTYMEAPMLYARLNDTGTAFEMERNLITFAGGLDGGGSVAADMAGNVYVTWHAPKPGNKDGEAGRAAFLARSDDEGKTFSAEEVITKQATGACGCCGMKTFADTEGNVYTLYRGATDKSSRSELLLMARKGESNFKVLLEDPWSIPSCPMSSASFGETAAATLAAWETEGRVYFARIDPKSQKATTPVAPGGDARRKHPVIVGNAKGEVLLVWTEGTGWAKGGSVAWQMFDAEDKPIADQGRADGVPVWSLATAVSKPNGFQVIY